MLDQDAFNLEKEIEKKEYDKMKKKTNRNKNKFH